MMRRMNRAGVTAQQKAEVEKATGKPVDKMTDAELEAEMKKRGMQVPTVEQEVEVDEDDYTKELESLAALRDKGVITEQEFQAKKTKLLGL
jgi:hypothetical protein